MKEIGYFFVSRADWARLVGASTDMIGAEYDAWLENVEKFKQQLVSQGLRPVQVDVDLDQFFAWCAGRDIDSRARADYAAGRMVQLQSD